MTRDLTPREYHIQLAESWHRDAQTLDYAALDHLVHGELLRSLRTVGEALVCDVMWAYHIGMAYLEEV